MKYYITFILAALIIFLSFMLAINYNNKLNSDTKIIINCSKYYAGTEPYVIKR